MNATFKVWGTTEALQVTPLFELHRLVIKPWHRCSMHMHRHKVNTFYVVSGELFIDTQLDRVFTKDSVEHHKMLPDSFYTILPGVKHQFRTQGLECVALEMYFCEPLSEDIVRDNEGGPVTPPIEIRVG